MAAKTRAIPHRELAVTQLLLVWLQNANPAFSPYQDLFDESEIRSSSAYARMVSELRAFFKTQPTFGPQGLDLIELLLSPAAAAPHSLADQLEFILAHWAALLGRQAYHVLGGLDLIKEEDRPVFFGPGPSVVPTYLDYEEPERFSPDTDWMPRTVLIAKNVYVWLDQLSRQYKKPIAKLDEIPDEELD